MAARFLPVVVLDASVTAHGDAPTLQQAFRRVFAFTAPLSLQKDSRTAYFAGNVRAPRGSGIIAAQVTPTRSMREVGSKFDRNEGYRFDETDAVVVSEAVATICMDTETGVTVLWERAAFPFTRLITFARRASQLQGMGWTLNFKPRVGNRGVRAWIDHFDQISAITFEYRHSQSPGDALVDRMIERLRARLIREKITANPGESLNLTPAQGERSLIDNKIQHLDVNPNNGRALIDGLVDGDEFRVDTSRQVERQRIEVEDPHYDSVVVALGGLARSFPR